MTSNNDAHTRAPLHTGMSFLPADTADWMADTGVLKAVRTALARFGGDSRHPNVALFSGAVRTLGALFLSPSLSTCEEGIQVFRRVRCAVQCWLLCSHATRGVCGGCVCAVRVRAVCACCVWGL